jgi:hypothetical protein
MTTRTGTTMIELMIILTVIMPLAVLTLGVAARIGHGPGADGGPAAALVSLQMRRDAKAGAVATADALDLGGHQWRAVAGWWCRDGVKRLRIDGAAWNRDGGVVSLRLQPHLLPVRSIELETTP